MKDIKLIVLMVFILSLTTQAQLFNGSKDLFYTQKAKNHNPGVFAFHTDFNYYSKQSNVIGDNGAKETYGVSAANAVFAYGFTNHIDATLGFRYYQKTNRETDPNVPDDLFLTLRFASFEFGDGHFYQGFLASSRFSTASQYNYPLAEYASGAIGFGAIYAVSFYFDKQLPERFFNLHANLGYWNHNEKGVIFKFEDGQELEAVNAAQEFRMAVALNFPTNYVDYRLELNGMLHIQRPDNFIYSAEEYVFLTPSLRIKTLDWLSIDLGADFRLSPDREWTTAEIPMPFPEDSGMPTSYPDWKIHAGINIKYNFKEDTGGEGLNKYQKQARERIEMKETMLNEIEKTKKKQKEVDELKKIRKETDEEIQNIKRVIDE